MSSASTSISFVDLTALHAPLHEDITLAIRRVLERSNFILGNEVQEFEESFASYCGVPHAVGVDSGFSALELALRGLGVGPGDEVVTVAHTFYATGAAIKACGAEPVFVDIDPSSYTMDPSSLEAALSERTRAVIPVHIYGQVADMDPIVEFCRRNDLWLIEDAAQAHGATYRGQKAGSFGDAAAFSFYPTKNLGALGDAGAVTTPHKDLAERLKVLRNCGQKEKNVHEVFGFNRRLDTLQAAVLKIKLEYLDEWNRLRGKLALLYNDLLSSIEEVQNPLVKDQNEHVYHLYVIQTKDRNLIAQEISKRGVQNGIHYPTPLHQQEPFKGADRRGLSVTESVTGRILSLPMHPYLTEVQVQNVAAALKESLIQKES